MAVAFALFDTLVEAKFPKHPAEAIAAELENRDVAVPDDWQDAYHETHIDPPEGAEVPLPAHVSRALASRGVTAPGNAPRRAVVSAFDPEVETREGAVEAVEAASERGPVAVLSNCRVPELARRALIRSEVDRDAFDAVVTSAACGWRVPHPKAFENCAEQLGVAPDELRYANCDGERPEAIADAFTDDSLAEVPAWLAARD
ncbi:HAD family hydrolase [Halorussus halophilus]|uniref:HAD family hydrolase n=1 Tax=Halorussus halophilus TaxID=2650975 RepID=UPI001301685C|nr:HAD family hydrolase [Halorussus halophilus]